MPATKVNLSIPQITKALNHQVAIMSRGLDAEINPSIKQLKEKDILEIRTAINTLETIK